MVLAKNIIHDYTFYPQDVPIVTLQLVVTFRFERVDDTILERSLKFDFELKNCDL